MSWVTKSLTYDTVSTMKEAFMLISGKGNGYAPFPYTIKLTSSAEANRDTLPMPACRPISCRKGRLLLAICLFS